MANIYEPTPETIRAREKWVQALPTSIQAVAARFLPWTAYRMKSTGVPVLLLGIQSDGTLAMQEDLGLKDVGETFPFVNPDDVEETGAPSWLTPEYAEELRWGAHVLALIQLRMGTIVATANLSDGPGTFADEEQGE